ncbi:MAG TPA: methyltransferase domain-containing protein [Ilumatobacteraceae bacterium]
MNAIKRLVRRLLRLPFVPQLRHVAERAFAPYIRADLTSMHQTMLELNHRLVHAEGQLRELDELRHYKAQVLNAISSTYGTTRLLRRELDQLRAEVDDHLVRLDGHIRDEVWPLAAAVEGFSAHVETIAFLLRRVETVRAEVLHELRYGDRTVADDVEVEIVNPDALVDANGDGLRLNLGCGHIPIDGYVNVDMRKLPGVDVVAPVNALPFEPGSVSEIFSAHVLEHFPEAELERRLLPYWRSVLRPGGTFRAVVPDIDSMIRDYQNGKIGFRELREVAYGGQEYEGDFHFTAFTPESLGKLLTDAGFEDITLVEAGRSNGECLEFELTARRPV